MTRLQGGQESKHRWFDSTLFTGKAGLHQMDSQKLSQPQWHLTQSCSSSLTLEAEQQWNNLRTRLFTKAARCSEVVSVDNWRIMHRIIEDATLILGRFHTEQQISCEIHRGSTQNSVIDKANSSSFAIICLGIVRTANSC